VPANSTKPKNHRCPSRLANGSALESFEDPVERLRLLRRRAVEPLAHLAGRGAAQRRLLAVQLLDEEVDRSVAEHPHGLPVERERIVPVMTAHARNPRIRVARVEVVLVRHGETEWSAALRHTGRTDLPLTQAGVEQARAVGEALRGREFALALSSPLRRALDTARLAGFEPRVRDELAEWDYGEYEGLTTVQIRQTVPDWTIWRYGARGGESGAEVGTRVDCVIEEILQVDGDVLVFGHGHLLRVLCARWLELQPRDGRLFALESATFSTLGFEREQRVIRAWNAALAGSE